MSEKTGLLLGEMMSSAYRSSTFRVKALLMGLLFVVLAGGLALSLGARSADGIVELSMTNMRFDKMVLRLPVDQPVTLTLRNDDGYAHSFDLDAFGVHVPLAGKERVTIQFTPNQAGAFPFYCAAAGHQAAGMTGTLIVEP